MQETWTEIEASLLQLYALPHNQCWLQQRGQSAADLVAGKLAEIRGGLIGKPTRENFVGPKMFLRVVGAGNRSYGGEWWFDADLLDSLDRAYQRLYFNRLERDGAIRALLREALAITTEWNTLDEVWSLVLPPGETLAGYSGIGTRQPLLGRLPITGPGNRMLVGGVRQIWFPVKNPFWVQLHRHLH